MTAFYMFRLMAMTFFGATAVPAWESGRTAPSRRPRRTACASRRSARARPGARGHEVRTVRRSRTTSAHDDHGRRRAWPRPVARPARIADADDVSADGARRRRDRRRLRRHSRRRSAAAMRSSTSSSRASRRIVGAAHEPAAAADRRRGDRRQPSMEQKPRRMRRAASNSG